MPGALYLYGKKLSVSSDDLFLPSVVGIITRSSMTAGFAVCLGFAISSETGDETLNAQCPTRAATAPELAFLATSVGYMALHLMCYIYMARISTMDTILHWHRRHKKAMFLIKVLSIAYFFELLLAVFGIIVTALNPCGTLPLMSNTFIVLLATVVTIWVDLAFALAYGHFLYQYFSPGKEREMAWYQRQLEKTGWGFNTLTCGIFGNLETPDGYGENAWIHLSEIFHTFLHDMMKDLAVSDVFASVLLLRAEQKRMNEEAVREHANRAFSMSDPGSSPFMLSSNGGPDDADSLGNSARQQSYLWGTDMKKIKLKVQTLASSTPISPRGSWISTLMSSEGRVADPARRLEAFQALEDFADYTDYQEAIYGWKLAFYDNPFRFLASFKWLNLSCLFPCSYGHADRKSLRISNVPRPNLRSQIEGRVFTHVAGLADHHVIYASFTAYLGESVPYTICVDHDRQCVLIVLRGTMSYADLVTDLMISPTELDKLGEQWGFDGKGHYAHTGMLQIASRIRYDIEKQQILDKLFEVRSGFEDMLPDGNAVQVQDMHGSEAYVTREQLKQTHIAHYQLKVVAHSLGAGIGSILSLLLRPKFPKITCLAYEPPGCIFSKELAEMSKEWIMSIVCGYDVVPRLSWHNAKHLRAQMFEMLRRSKTNKPTVMSTLFRNIPAEDLLYDVGSVPEEEERTELSRMIQKLSVDSDSLLDKVKLLLPGKILHLSKNSTTHHGCFKGKDRQYTPMWVDDREDFNTIHITQWLLWDHFPNNNGRMIRKTVKEALKAEGRMSFGGAKLMDSMNPKLEV